MADPIVIHVERPYATEDDFLDAEGWSITSRSMLLIGVGPLPEGTPLRCELRLSTGAPLILAEGTAVKHLAVTATRPAGLVVRYKRMSAASSEFVQRAIERSAGIRPTSMPAAAPVSPALAAASQTSLTPARASSAPPRQRAAASPPPRNSNRPTANLPSVRPASGRKSSTPPKDAGLEPAARASAKRSVSVRPPVQGSARPSQMAAAQTGVRSSPPGRSNTNRPTAEPQTKGPSTRRDSSATQRRYDRDSAAMQRLRSRASGKSVSSPPDREVILSRLKKKPER